MKTKIAGSNWFRTLLAVIIFAAGYFAAYQNFKSSPPISSDSRATTYELDTSEVVPDSEMNKSGGELPISEIRESSIVTSPLLDSADLDKSKEKVPVLSKVDSLQKQLDARDLMAQLEWDVEAGISDPVSQSFYKEEVDVDWAVDYESALYNAFSDSNVISAYSVKSLECRSVRCKVVFDVDTFEQTEAIGIAISKSLLLGTRGLKYGDVMSFYDMENNSATWFIGRDARIQLLNGEVYTPN